MPPEILPLDEAAFLDLARQAPVRVAAEWTEKGAVRHHRVQGDRVTGILRQDPFGKWFIDTVQDANYRFISGRLNFALPGETALPLDSRERPDLILIGRA